MKKTLTTQSQVIGLAFAECEYMPATAVSEAEIAVAEERCIVPVTGRALYEKMLAGSYAELRDEYAVPTAAIFTRVGMQPLTDVRSGRFGTVAPRPEYGEPADRERILDLRRSLLRKGRTLQRRMSDFLERNAADYPEYDPRENILNRCSTDGGYIQIF